MFGTLKDTISLPNGVAIGRTTVGAVMVEDKDGKRRVLDDMDAAEWLFYSVKGEFPASPRIPTDPASQERARQAQAAIEARKVRNFTVTQDAEGNVIVTLDDGTVATIPTTN